MVDGVVAAVTVCEGLATDGDAEGEAVEVGVKEGGTNCANQ